MATDTGLYEALAASFRQPDCTAVVEDHEAPCEVCGGTRYFERIARYPGWYATLLVEQQYCASCGYVHELGRLVVSESWPPL